jgi:hypothetical protein
MARSQSPRYEGACSQCHASCLLVPGQKDTAIVGHCAHLMLFPAPAAALSIELFHWLWYAAGHYEGHHGHHTGKIGARPWATAGVPVRRSWQQQWGSHQAGQLGWLSAHLCLCNHLKQQPCTRHCSCRGVRALLSCKHGTALLSFSMMMWLQACSEELWQCKTQFTSSLMFLGVFGLCWYP